MRLLEAMLNIYEESPTLDEILEQAGEATAPPPEPAGGIPRQWLPSWIRWPLRILFLPFVLLDLATQRIAKWIIRPPFKQEGKCLKRGNLLITSCCQKSRDPLVGSAHFGIRRCLDFINGCHKSLKARGNPST